MSRAMPDPLSDIDVLLAAASDSDTDSVRLMFVARARCAHTVAKRQLAAAELLLVEQELELDRRLRRE